MQRHDCDHVCSWNHLHAFLAADVIAIEKISIRVTLRGVTVTMP